MISRWSVPCELSVGFAEGAFTVACLAYFSSGRWEQESVCVQDMVKDRISAMLGSGPRRFGNFGINNNQLADNSLIPEHNTHAPQPKLVQTKSNRNQTPATPDQFNNVFYIYFF